MTHNSFTSENVKLTVADPAKVRDLWLEPDDILIERANTPELVGTAALFRGPSGFAIFPDLMIRARVHEEINATYVISFLKSPRARQYFQERAQGIAGSMPKIDQGTVESLLIPLPPRPEQDRIAAAIDQHLSDIDAGVAALERALLNLKRYRASILKNACEGKLVPTEAELARKEGREYEPAAVLLERILTERRARWEAEQLAKMAAKGQVPKDDKWKARYEEPKGPETSKLAGLPEGWVWTTMDAVLTGIEAGSSFKCDERQPGPGDIGVVKVSAVTWGTYDESESKTCTDASRVDPALFVASGDFLFSRANTIELVGACVIAGPVTQRIMLSDKILRFRLGSTEPKWVLYALRSRHGRDEIEQLATGNQESMRNIGQIRIREIRVPLPPLAEQQRIVTEVDRLLSIADETETVLRAQRKRAEVLRRAVLKAAFEGKLVPQDPRDEPASALLARLQAERAAAATATRKAPRAAGAGRAVET